MTSILIGHAVAAVTAVADKLQADLDAAAAAARAANLAACRETLRNLVPEDDAMRPVAELLAATITIGQDGYPTRSIPEDTARVYAAAIRALGHSVWPPAHARVGGLLGVLSTFEGEGSIVDPYINLDRICIAQHRADYTAWDAAQKARKRRITL